MVFAVYSPKVGRRDKGDRNFGVCGLVIMPEVQVERLRLTLMVVTHPRKKFWSVATVHGTAFCPH